MKDFCGVLGRICSRDYIVLELCLHILNVGDEARKRGSDNTGRFLFFLHFVNQYF